MMQVLMNMTTWTEMAVSPRMAAATSARDFERQCKFWEGVPQCIWEEGFMVSVG